MTERDFHLTPSSGGDDAATNEPWLVLVVDDDPDILSVTQLVILDLVYKNRTVDLLEAASAAEAKEIFKQNPDIAVIISGGVIAQIITNLTINALDHAFGTDGEGIISVVVEEQEAGNLALKFADNGKGIPKEFHGKVFDAFFTTARGSGGTGLGLSIIHSLVTESLGGAVDLESAANGGTIFTIRFPKRSPDPSLSK